VIRIAQANVAFTQFFQKKPQKMQTRKETAAHVSVSLTARSQQKKKGKQGSRL
jgi:menaquinone-dependent protoporphyrinogen IX oxidase